MATVRGCCVHEKHDIVSFFLGRPPPAGAALRILRSNLGRGRGCPCPVAGRSLRPSMAFAHSMLTSLRHPACDDQSAETDRCPSNAGARDMGSPSRTCSRTRAGCLDTEASCVHEKHDIVSFFLGKRSLLVLRKASCHATNEGGLPEHRSERQAPRRRTRTIVQDPVAEPPCERSVFGEPARWRSRLRIAYPPRRAKLLLPY